VAGGGGVAVEGDGPGVELPGERCDCAGDGEVVDGTVGLPRLEQVSAKAVVGQLLDGDQGGVPAVDGHVDGEERRGVDRRDAVGRDRPELPPVDQTPAAVVTIGSPWGSSTPRREPWPLVSSLASNVTSRRPSPCFPAAMPADPFRGEWSKDSKTNVATMADNDFRHNEKSVILENEDTLSIVLKTAE
jgi:hypothetical protein